MAEYNYADMQPLVLTGNTIMKAGFGGEEEPRAVFPCIVGRQRNSVMGVCYAGDEAYSKRRSLNLALKYPTERGMITDWDAMETVWHHTFFKQLHVVPEEHPILLGEATHTPEQNRSRMSQFMFETYNVPALAVAMQPLLSLYASGSTNGIVVHCGGGESQVVPFCEGYALPQAVTKLNIGGHDLNEILQKQLLIERSYLFDPSSNIDEREVLRDIKEKVGYVAFDYEDELDTGGQVEQYELPGGQVLTIGESRFQCPEVLFQPSLMGLNDGGIHEATYNSIINCDVDIRQGLYQNIILSGGSTMFPGFVERFTREFKALAPSNWKKIKVVAPSNRNYTTWTGGSVFASLPTFQENWVSRSEYDEYGPSIIHQKCFV